MKIRMFLTFTAALSSAGVASIDVQGAQGAQATQRAQAAQGSFRTLTIDGAVAEAVQANLSLLAERSNLSIADAAAISARLRPNPVLSGGADSLDLLGTGFDTTNQAGPPQYSVRVDVPFERGHKREMRTEVAFQAKRVAEAQFAEAVRHLKLDVTLAAIDVLEARAKLQLAEDNLAALTQLLQLNQQRFESGAIPQLEVTRSRVAMLQYRGNVKTAQLALNEARLKLLPLLGKQPDETRVDIDDRLGTGLAPEPNLAVLQQTARATRPDLLALRNDQARTQADLKLELAQGKVDYTLGAEYRREQGVNGRGNMLGLFFSVPLPLFNRNQGDIARAEAERDKAGRLLAAGETNAAGEVASAYQEFQSASELLAEIERELLTPTLEARAGVTYMYQAGATSLLDVLDAQRAFNDTMDTYYSAQASYRRAQARLSLASNKDVRP
jgi:cobalt-zinc-cadmium efflux system outer membrane protein